MWIQTWPCVVDVVFLWIWVWMFYCGIEHNLLVHGEPNVNLDFKIQSGVLGVLHYLHVLLKKCLQKEVVFDLNSSEKECGLVFVLKTFPRIYKTKGNKNSFKRLSYQKGVRASSKTNKREKGEKTFQKVFCQKDARKVKSF